MILHIRFILAASRGTKIWRPNTGGTIWSVMFGRVCCLIRHLPKSKSKTPKTWWIVTEIEDPIMKMGRDRNGLRNGITSYPGCIWFHMDHSGSFDIGCPLHSNQDNLLGSQTCRAAHAQNCMHAWRAQENCVRQRHLVYVQGFGQKFTSLWIPSWISALHIIRILMDKHKEPTKFLKICWELAFWSMEKIGTRVFHK
jgi:hypothetical protein